MLIYNQVSPELKLTLPNLYIALVSEIFSIDEIHYISLNSNTLIPTNQLRLIAIFPAITYNA